MKEEKTVLKEQEVYEAPSIDVIDVKVEQGFAASPGRDEPSW